MKYYFECPNCQSDSSFSRPSEEPSLGAWLLPLVDPFAAAVYGDSRRRRVQCDHCGYLFRQPPLPKSGTTRLANTILVLQILTAAVAAALFLWPELTDGLPTIPWLDVITGMLSGRAGLFLLLGALSVSMTILICLVACVGSTLAQKRALANDFQIRVRERDLTVREPPVGGQ